MTQQKIKSRRQPHAEQAAADGLAAGNQVLNEPNAGPQKISTQALSDRLARQEPVYLLDVREREEFDICHLDGATLMPVSVIPNNYKRIPADVPVVVYCHHGIRSAKVAEYLFTQTGRANIFSLDGGINAWAHNIDPDMATY